MSVDPFTLTTDRLIATAAVLVALAGAIIGGIGLARPNGRRSMVAVVSGLIGMIVGGLVVATADGGPGTGNGIVGGYAAVAVGLIATILGGLALARSRRRSTASLEPVGTTDDRIPQ
jgi:Kef-type K+ transport system membrane component KefB